MTFEQVEFLVLTNSILLEVQNAGLKDKVLSLAVKGLEKIKVPEAEAEADDEVATTLKFICVWKYLKGIESDEFKKLKNPNLNFNRSQFLFNMDSYITKPLVARLQKESDSKELKNKIDAIRTISVISWPESSN